MANISNVITVSLTEAGSTADRDQMNVVGLITQQQDGTVSSANRYELYADLASVGTDFGTSSAVYEYASAFFGTSPNPINATGALAVCYWRGAEETVAATSAVLTSGDLDTTEVISNLQAITDGNMIVTADGVAKTLAAMDFSLSTTLTEVVAVINVQLLAQSSASVATVSGDTIVLTSTTTGASSTLTYVTDSASGTYVGDILSLSSGSGASFVDGEDVDVLSVETKVDGITAIKAAINIKGAMFIDKPSDADVALLGAWAQANDTLMYDVFFDTDELLVAAANVVWINKLAGYTNYRCLFSLSNNRKMAASYMARVHTVNFGAENSALTMHLKELSVSAEEYTQTQITNAKKVGLDLYTTIKNTPAILTSGVNDFVDNRYNLIAFVDAVATDLYNLLKATGTKVPQTAQGVARLTDQCEKTSREFVRAGFLAPGTWTSTDFFGNETTFDQNILDNGFYWLAGKLSDQSAASRANRESPVIQGAIKAAGAIHSASIIINFNL